MKYLKFLFISIVFFVLAITAGSSHSVTNTLLTKSKPAPTLQNKDDVGYENKNLPLHGDVWFAFAAIGAISTYLAFKRK
ncbi:MAG: hypothetical protein WC622_07040 [Pedobacter sp.]|jgi:hypothetical protein|uniref:hypothetical protein n=1 Tax=Pedobacter sp. TaxID=1411316 RepID=UPI00356938D1